MGGPKFTRDYEKRKTWELFLHIGERVSRPEEKGSRGERLVVFQTTKKNDREVNG